MGTEWQCDECAHVNEKIATSCDDCGSLRPDTCPVCNERSYRGEPCGWDCQSTLDGMKLGVALAFGIVGMFEAIRANAPRVVERSYWTSEIDGQQLYDCPCPGCGVLMKRREAGKDEGTDAEWCGSCRPW